MSIYENLLSEIEKGILIKTEVDGIKEFCIKTEPEHLHLITGSDDVNATVNEITFTVNLMWRLYNEMENSAEPKECLRKAHLFITQSNLLLRLVKEYEMKFSIYPNSTTQDSSQIGSLIWYRGVLGIICRLETILMVITQNNAADIGTVALRFEKIVQTKRKWQAKAQGRYPNAQ